MLIVSKAHDFYDSAIGLGGVDKTVVYLRKEEDLRVKPRGLRDLQCYRYTFGRDRYEVFIELTIIGFCGELHKAIGFHVYKEFRPQPPIFYRYSVESALKAFHELGIPLEEKHSWAFSRRFGSSYYFSSSYQIDSQQDLKKFFSEDPLNKQEALEAFGKHKTPVFSFRYGDDGFVLNPCLKTYGFQQVKDPFTAFQEIHGFISGVLGVDARPMIELSDASKIEKHGFFKWSFRKEPWKKTKKKNPPLK